VNGDDALLRLGESTAQAVEGVLQMFTGKPIERGAPSVAPSNASPFDAVALPAVVTKVAYVDGVRGGNVFTLTTRGARRLAATMMGEDPREEGEAGLTELELSAMGEAMNQMMSAAAIATSSVLGHEVEIGPPETLIVETRADAANIVELAAYSVATTFIIDGESARLVQLVPQSFVVRMTRALSDLAAVSIADDGSAPTETVTDRALQGVGVRLSAELGRFQMPIGRAVMLAPGSVVTLDTAADDPVSILVNGLPFGSARLLVTGEGSWALRLEHLTPTPHPSLSLSSSIAGGN
jgi:flagellar motor switch protein FliN/FliY